MGAERHTYFRRTPLRQGEFKPVISTPRVRLTQAPRTASTKETDPNLTGGIQSIGEVAEAPKGFPPVARYRLELCAVTPVVLPHYPGSAWRGVFGRALRKTVCITGLPTCPDCRIYHQCLYPYIFETPPPPQTPRMRNYPVVPQPYVIEPRVR